MEASLAGAREGPLIDFDQIVVTVDERLVAQLLESATPYERVVDDKYRIRLDSAQVSFRGGLGLVRLEGRASLAGRDEETVFADVRVYGALEVLGLDPTSGVLRAKVNVIAFEVPQVGVMGISAPVRRLVEQLATESVEKFNVLASDLEIPVAIEQDVEIPGVGPEGEVSIEAASIPLRVAVGSVKVIAGKMWISIGVEVQPSEPEQTVAALSLPRGEVLVDTTRWHTGREAVAQPPLAMAGAETAADTLDLPRPAGGSEAAEIVAVADSGTPRLRELRGQYAALVDSLLAATARDTLLYQVATDSGDVGVAIRPELIERLVREASARYLDRVELDIPLEEDVKEGEDVRVKALITKVNAGRWDVHVTIHRVRGLLAAKAPGVSVAGENRLRVTIPLLFREGHGTATVRFRWDAKGVASAACRDFQTALDVDGAGIPREYVVIGDLLLAVQDDRIVARPEFPVQKIRISVEPSAETWSKVRATLSELDKVEKCGIGLQVLSADKVVNLLKGVLAKGFKVKLPTKLVPTLELPASVSESVKVEDQELKLAVKPLVLRVTPRAFWYSASVDAEMASASEKGQVSTPTAAK